MVYMIIEIPNKSVSLQVRNIGKHVLVKIMMASSFSYWFSREAGKISIAPENAVIIGPLLCSSVNLVGKIVLTNK